MFDLSACDVKMISLYIFNLQISVLFFYFIVRHGTIFLAVAEDETRG